MWPNIDYVENMRNAKNNKELKKCTLVSENVPEQNIVKWKEMKEDIAKEK